MPDDGGDVSKLDYNASSATKYSVLFHAKTDPLMELSVDGSQYTISFDLTKASNYDSTGPGSLKSVINYTDDNNFTVDLTLAGFNCDPNDVRAPDTIGIHLELADGLWQGKAMMALPRWVGDQTCATAPTTDTEMFIYSDFVGDAANTTMSVYMLPGAATIDKIANYPASSLCSSIPSMCQGGYAVGSTNPVSVYTNPTCVTADSDLGWGSACASSEAKIAAPTYGDQGLWTEPQTLQGTAITVPASL